MDATKKYKMHKFNKDCYFLGQDKEGTNYFLEEATFDCEWYYGGGYVETYNNNKNPQLAKDKRSHQHFDGLFLKGNKNAFDAFKEYFVVTPFTDSEVWKICELMNSFYIARHYSDMIYAGSGHYSVNPCKDVIKNETEYKRINEVVIPEIMKNLYEIMTDEEN